MQTGEILINGRKETLAYGTSVSIKPMENDTYMSHPILISSIGNK